MTSTRFQGFFANQAESTHRRARHLDAIRPERGATSQPPVVVAAGLAKPRTPVVLRANALHFAARVLDKRRTATTKTPAQPT